jgi:hypothetical protein
MASMKSCIIALGCGVVLAGAVAAQAAVLWHAGTFRTLEVVSGDLVAFVQGLDHPNTPDSYEPLDATRAGDFTLFLETLFTAIEASLTDGETGDWCGVQTQAGVAGYAIARFYDTDSGRWFVYAYDTTPSGQAYVFINPFAKRNLVIEVPHEDFEAGTKTQGVRLFKALAARALVINKAHRCAAPEESECGGGVSTHVCGGDFRASDVAHDTRNAFHLLHRRYTDTDPVTKFVQLHGFEASHGDMDMVEIGDGTTTDQSLHAVSVTFANQLKARVPTPGAVFACQESVGDPPSNLCGESNVQAQYTNHPGSNACPGFTSTSSGRFLHVEQEETLRDDNPRDGWDWRDIRDALLGTWPACNMNNGTTDCTLGPQQTPYPTRSCS